MSFFVELWYVANLNSHCHLTTITTAVEAKTAMPMDITMRTKACKYFGTMCTPDLGFSENSLSDEWHIYSMYGNATYPNPGLYGFEKTFTMPSNSLTDFPYAGFHFTLVSDMQADDTTRSFIPHLRCHAQFTTVNYDTFRENGTTGSGFNPNFGGKWSMVGLVGLMGGYAGFMERKRRVEAARPTLTLDDDSVATDFEMMPAAACGYGSEDTDSVRV